MYKKTLFILPVMLVAACAYTLDKQFQPLTLRTPGALNSRCDVYADKVRYKFYPPETRNIKNSNDDLIIECMAPGNRNRRVVIEANISKYAAGNILTGFVPGVMWDYASDSIFTYPDTVEIDFRGMKARPSGPPAHNYEDTVQPEDYNLEEFSPGDPRMNSDKYNVRIPLLRRGEGAGFGEGFSDSSAASQGQAAAGYSGSFEDKGDLMSVIENLDSSIDPSGPQSPAAPLFPGD